MNDADAIALMWQPRRSSQVSGLEWKAPRHNSRRPHCRFTLRNGRLYLQSLKRACELSSLAMAPAGSHSLSHLTSRHQASAVQSDFRGESNPTAVRTCPNVRTSFPLKKQDMKHDDEGHSAVRRAKTSAPAASKGCMRRGNATSNLYLLASIAIHV